MRYFLFALALFTLIACSQRERAMSGKDALPHLEERKWQLVNLNQQAVTLSSKPYFLIKGTSVEGNAGCNSFTGSVKVDGSIIAFSKLTSLLMTCDAIQIEKEFIEALLEVNGYRQNTDTLFLLRDQRPLAVLLNTPEQ